MEILQTHITQFESRLTAAVELFRRKDDMLPYLKAIAEEASSLAEGIVALGDFAFEKLEEEETAYSLFHLHYAWADSAKAFLVLWRDVLLEEEKAQILLWDKKTDKKAVEKLREDSYNAISDAAYQLLEAMNAANEEEEKKNIENWKHQKNPWPTYKEQILLLPGQCLNIQERYTQLQEVAEIFRQTREKIRGLILATEKENEEFSLRAKDTIGLIGECLPDEGEPRPGRIASRLEDMSALMDLPKLLEELNADVLLLTEKLPEKMRLPMASEGGMIQYKELALQKSVLNWLEAKIMPVVFEIWEIAEHVRNNIKTTLLNIQNRSSVLAAELKEGKAIQATRKDVCQPLDLFLDNAAKWYGELQEQKEVVERRLARSFFLSGIYHPQEEFLSLPFQSSIKYLKQNKNEFRLRAENSWLQIQQLLRKIRQTVVEEDSLSPSEKLIRFIQSRRPEEAHTNYTSIFLTKGYIGESFWVGREKELKHIAQLIENWNKGFRGAVVLHGQRMSGKSLFGELVANRFFPKNCIRLQPNSLLKIKGRRMTTSYDLGEALEFVRKHSLNFRPLIWIDDLELWREPQIPLSQNIRNLRHHLDNYADDQFFMISMGNWLKDHLEQYHELEQVLHSSIRLDRMDFNEVLEAIWIRHGATNKKLVDATGNEAEPRLFRKWVSKLYKSGKGNIGEAINRWAYSIVQVDEENVQFKPSPRYGLPDFLTPDAILLLDAFMMNKRTNEYQLRKMFGPAFKTKYSNLLNQLIGVGVLVRQLDGWLEVNELVVNDLGKILEHKKSQLAY